MPAARASKLWVIAGCLVAVLLTAATYLLVIAPARSDVASVQSQVDDASVQQNVLRHRLNDLQSIAKDMSGLQGQLAAAKAALPTSVDTQGLLRRVQSVAQSVGGKVHDVTIGSPLASPVDGVFAIPVSLVVDGTSDALVNVLGQLQSDQSRLLTVSGSTLKEADGGLSLSLTVDVYATSAPAAAAGGTAASGTAPGTSAGPPAAGTTNAS